MSQVKVGVVGVGSLGKEHARVLSAMKEVELVGVVDADPDHARSVARKCKTRAYDSVEPLLEQARAVTVVVPTIHHHAMAMPFLERGTSVLVEKPMSFSVGEAEEMVATAARTGAKLQVGHIERFNPGFQAITKLGIRPLFIEAHRLSPFPFRSTDVGVVFDLMIHDIDIVQTIVPGEITHLDALGVSVMTSHEDIANVRMTFEDECVANLTASRISLKKMRKVRFFSPDSYITMDTGERKAIVYRKKPGFDKVARQMRGQSALKQILTVPKAYRDLVDIHNIRLDRKEPLRAELESFVACVREDRDPEVPGEDGVKAVRVAEAIVLQIRRRVKETTRELPT